MDIGMWVFLSVVCCLVIYIPSSKYIKAWLNKRRRLSKMQEVAISTACSTTRIWIVC